MVLGVVSSLAIMILLRKRELVALQCGCLCSVSLYQGAVGSSAVCDCGVSWPYFLHWFNKKIYPSSARPCLIAILNSMSVL